METKSNKPGSIKGSSFPQNSQPVSIQTINEVVSTSDMHFNGNSIFYSLNEHEFKTIINGTENYWKELAIACWCIFIPLIINSISIGSKLKWDTSLSNLDLFLNSAFSIITLILSIVFSIAWYYSSNELKKVIKEVQDKPKFRLQ